MEIDEELLNRCLVLTVDEDREQTQAIHARQRAARELPGRLAKKSRDGILKVHRDAQRLLRPLVEYIEVTLEDVAVANRLAHQVLGRSLDELAPQTRRMLALLDAHVAAACERQAMERKDFRFSRKEVRETTGFGITQTRVHLDRLVELEYVLVHRGANGQGYVYELVWDGKPDGGGPHLPGLVDVESLGASTTATWRGSKADLAGTLRPAGGPDAGTRRGSDDDALSDGESASNATNTPKRAHKASGAKGRSYAPPVA
jgi:hypothetical protein